MAIVVATRDIQRVGPLVESKKVLYNRRAMGNRPSFTVANFSITDTAYGHFMTEENYEAELMHTDIVDEVI
jgi:hypothetical protein